MRLRRGLPLLSSLAADMSNLVLDVMAGSLTASVPLPVSTLEGVSFRCLDLDQARGEFTVSAARNPRSFCRVPNRRPVWAFARYSRNLKRRQAFDLQH
jgi:hypothetical protein